MITADCGGSNGYRVRLWKVALQRLSNEAGLRISVCHFPPGTSKWNKIEHRMFSYISMNWRGRPLTSHEVDVLINLQTLVCVGTFPRGLRNEVMAWVVANQNELIEEWKKWHP